MAQEKIIKPVRVYEPCCRFDRLFKVHCELCYLIYFNLLGIELHGLKKIYQYWVGVMFFTNNYFCYHIIKLKNNFKKIIKLNEIHDTSCKFSNSRHKNGLIPYVKVSTLKFFKNSNHIVIDCLSLSLDASSQPDYIRVILTQFNLKSRIGKNPSRVVLKFTCWDEFLMKM